MSATKTTISWTDRTWNVLRGCSRVSEGCMACYAEAQAGRFSGPGQPYEGLVRKTSQGFKWTGDVRFITKDLDGPLRWQKPSRIFVNSMSDLWHESVPDAWIDQIYAVMLETEMREQAHTFQILTKRAERLHAYFAGNPWPRVSAILKQRWGRHCGAGRLWAPECVWLGVSCENQATADARIPWLLKTPAAVRFLSCEPLLEPLRVDRLGRIDWVIVGGESGHQARRCDVAWIRALIDQCAAEKVACWVKQMGAYSVRRDAHDSLAGPARQRIHWQDRKGSDPDEWPLAWRVQQFPQQKEN